MSSEIKIVEGLAGKPYAIGYEIFQERGTALIPLCPFNGQFKFPYVSQLIRFAEAHFDQVHVFIPDTPSYNTLRAWGKDTIEARVERQVRRLERMVYRTYNHDLPSRNLNDIPEDEKQIPDNITVNRFSVFEKNPIYLAEREPLDLLMEENEAYRAAVENETEMVLFDKVEEKVLSQRVRLGTPYVNDEFGFLSAAARIYNVERLAYMYHQQWFLDKFLAGRFDRERENVGLLIVDNQ